MNEQNKLKQLKSELISLHNGMASDPDLDDFSKGMVAGLANAIYRVQELLGEK
jgi:hypothetical protein